MKKVWGFIAAVLFFSIFSATGLAAVKSGTIVIEPSSAPTSKHIIVFRVGTRNGARFVDGLFDGLLKRRSVRLDDMKSINFDGSVMDAGTSVITSISPTQAVAVITGTPEKEEQGGIWNVELKSGEILAFDPARWNFRGVPITISGLVRFNGSGGGTPPPVAQESRMDFTGGKLEIRLGSDQQVKGFISGVNLADIQDFRWSSDKKGWGDGSTAVAVLPRNTNGNPILPVVVTIPGLDPDDNGNVVIKKKDGTLVWCNIGFEGWKFSQNVRLDQQNGRIIYTGNK